MKEILREGAPGRTPVVPRTAAENESHASEAQPSPLPWRIELDGNGQANVYGADDQWIAIMPHQCLGSLEAVMHVNAKLIVRACNHHEALLAALKVAEEFVHLWMQDNTGPRELDALEQIEAAIKNAEGK